MVLDAEISVISCKCLHKMLIKYGIEDTKKIAEQAKSIEDKIEAAETLQEVGQQAAAQEIQQTYRRSLDETKEKLLLLQQQ
jgi:hypothetical protein